eukprot:TRINITY_DN3744_c0_g2_i1.p1 TRINITY_DN3744_c0_g2~~TRINITY_DN3744_c0_g2_i1.p1  ORF type:complete len:368 (+),score=76.22 TRINITY_DN3744_c0_g2_i1:61-1164(+)
MHNQSWLPPSVANMSEAMAAGIVYSLSSISMLLVNKLAVRAFHETFLLLAMQNIGTLAIRKLWTIRSGEPQVQSEAVNLHKLKYFSPAIVLFMVMLFSSLRSLFYVSIPTVIVFRNINSLAVAFGEIALLKKVITRDTWTAMGVIIIGAFAYANWDIEFHALGYFWTFLNIAAMCGYSLYVKWVMGVVKYTPMEMVYFNNVVSTPVFLLCSLYLGERWAAFPELFSPPSDQATADSPSDQDPDMEFSYAGAVWVTLSCTLAFAISASGFWAQAVFSATTWITLNNINKIPVILLSAYIFSDKLSAGSIFGLVISLIGGGMYSWATRPNANKQAPEKKAEHEDDEATHSLIKDLESGHEKSIEMNRKY